MLPPGLLMPVLGFGNMNGTIVYQKYVSFTIYAGSEKEEIRQTIS
jgi:hypothetical protein